MALRLGCTSCNPAPEISSRVPDNVRQMPPVSLLPSGTDSNTDVAAKCVPPWSEWLPIDGDALVASLLPLGLPSDLPFFFFLRFLTVLVAVLTLLEDVGDDWLMVVIDRAALAAPQHNWSVVVCRYSGLILFIKFLHTF